MIESVSESAVRLGEAGVLMLSGVLDYRTGPALRKEGQALIKSISAAEVVIDCSAVQKSSSVGLTRGGGSLLAVATFSHTHTDRHDQFQFLLHGAQGDAQAFGDLLVTVAMQAAENEDLLLSRTQGLEADVQAFEQLLGMGGVLGTALGGDDVVDDFRRYVIQQGPRLDAPGTQMVQRQVAGGLENKGFEVLDRAFGQCTGDTQVGFLEQVFGGTGVADHALEGAQQRCALGEEDVMKARLTHGRARSGLS